MTYVKDPTEQSLPEDDRRCAVASCGGTAPLIYDEHFEHYYCDRECLEVFITENPSMIAEAYARIYIYEN